MVAIDTPRTPEQLKEALLDDGTRKTLMENPENFERFVADYSANLLKDGGLAEMIKDGQQEGMLEARRAFNGKGNRLPMGDGDEGEGEAAEWDTGYGQGRAFRSNWASETWTKAKVQGKLGEFVEGWGGPPKRSRCAAGPSCRPGPTPS